jgi:fructose PTS system EIIBC or EIIC component
MNLSRYMNESLIRLQMSTEIEPPQNGNSVDKWRNQAKEQILEELVEILDTGARIGNRTRLLTDFVNRERKASTALGHGVAVPHIRSLQAKDFMIAFARSTEGYDFGAPDDAPVHLFFVMAAPPYDDTLYLKAFKALSELLHDASFRNELMSLTSPGEVIRAIRMRE